MYGLYFIIKKSPMKRVISIICGVFLLIMITENINLIYAENNEETNEEFNGIDSDNNEWLSFSRNKTIDYNDIINFADIPSNDNIITHGDEYTSEELMELQYNLSNQAKVEEKQIFEVEQTEQYIDTSDYGIIRISDPENSKKWITIHDRNLWATNTWAWTNAPNTSYWYYYQWGNNYGFPTTGDIEKVLLYSETNIDASSFWSNNPYSSDTFIKLGYDWSHTWNDNLWWWIWDNGNNWRWYPVNNAADRKWPCPEWYHIPSIWEWSKLLEFWAYEYTWAWNEVTLITSDSLSKIATNNTASTNFYKKLNIPLAGQRDYDSSNTNDYNKWGLMWSSSPENSSTSAFRMFWEKDKVSTNNRNSRAWWSSVRCFLNSYRLPIIITYDINWWYWSWENNSERISLIYTSDDGIIYNPNKELQNPKKESICWVNGDKKCMFAWWYLWIENDTEMRTWDIDGDITVYAKWLPFEDKDITLSRVNFTIMDRNLWAMDSGTGENAFWYYLTWDESIMCPEWYHIPSTWEWLWIKDLLNSDFSWSFVRDSLNLPLGGVNKDNEITWTGGFGYYLAKDWNYIKYAKISDLDIEIKNFDEWEKVSARCFKDYNTWIIKFNSNGWNSIDEILAVNWREEWENLMKPERENSIFTWWYTTNSFQNWTKIEKNINYKNEEEFNVYAKWDCVEWYKENTNQCEAIYFEIKWIDGNGNILKTDNIKRWKMPVYNWIIPTKNSTSNFNYTFNGKWLPEITVATWDAEYIAQFNEETIKKSGWNSSWWGRRKSSNVDTHWAANSTSTAVINSDKEIIKDLSDDNKRWENILKNTNDWNEKLYMQSSSLYSEWWEKEFIDAYNFARKYWITTVSSINDAKMYSPLTRIQMAKILSYFAINVLWKKPDVSKWTIKFDDVTNKINSEHNNWVTLAYQLDIMWKNISNNHFRPNDEVTRAELVTALSRLLYWTEDWTWNVKYYEPHMAKLYNEWIISGTDSKIKEKRWYLLIMLLRSLNK